MRKLVLPEYFFPAYSSKRSGAALAGALSVVILSFLPAISVVGNPPGSVDLSGQVDNFLASMVKGRNFSGSLLIARGNKILLSKGYGLADVAHRVANSPESKFQIGSLSKSFTAAAIYYLEEDAKLRRDDPINRFIPDYPGGDKITVRHLLGHTSGLPRIVFFPDFAEKSRSSLTPSEIVEWVAGKPTVGKPGERYSYSNANYSFLARIIEVCSGTGYGEYLEKRVFQTFGLSDTGHRASPKLRVEHLSEGYDPVGFTDLEQSRYFDYTIFTGSGSLYSTTSDLLSWFNANYSGKVAGDALRARVRDENSENAFGWLTEERLGRKAVVLRGWDGVGYSAQLVHFIDDDLTLIVLCNLNISGVSEEVADAVAAISLGEKPDLPKLKEKPSQSAEELSKMAGVYRFGKDFYVPDSRIEFRASGAGLAVPAQPPAPPGALIPVSDGSFIHRQHWIRVRFEKDEDGRYSSIRYGRFTAKRESE